MEPLLIEEESTGRENIPKPVAPPKKIEQKRQEKQKERGPSPLFNELNMQEKMLIQDNLEKMYARFQAKNFNAHFKKQKMPFPHHDHPVQNQYPV